MTLGLEYSISIILSGCRLAINKASTGILLTAKVTRSVKREIRVVIFRSLPLQRGHFDDLTRCYLLIKHGPTDREEAKSAPQHLEDEIVTLDGYKWTHSSQLIFIVLFYPNNEILLCEALDCCFISIDTQRIKEVKLIVNRNTLSTFNLTDS